MQLEISSKFQSQLLRLFEMPGPLENNEHLQQRLHAAVTHFTNELNSLLDFVQKCTAVTDSKIHAKEFNDTIRELFSQLSLKNYFFKNYDSIINIKTYQEYKKRFVLPSFFVNAYAGTSSKQDDNIAHPTLYQQLRKLRDSICAQRDLPIYIVAGSNTLNEIANYLPQSLTELRQIIGFGDAKIEKYGQQFLDIVLHYCKERNLHSQMQLKTLKRERKTNNGTKEKKPDTKIESFKLFKEGNTIADIAVSRNRSLSTIETHLAYFVETGEIKIEELLSPEKLSIIEPVIKELGTTALAPLKEKLGDEIGFGDLRFAVAWYIREKKGEIDN